MGYSPAAIGLSYVPQTIAFLVGGYGCRAALQKWQGQQMLPWLLVLYALSVIGTWAVGFIPGAGLAEILIPFCVMAIANGAISDCRGAGVTSVPAGNGPRGSLAEHTATGAVLPGKPGGIGTDCHAAADHHQRDAGYRCAAASAIVCSHRHSVRRIRQPRLKHRMHNRASNYVTFQ
jgi:hypothetical protein